MWNRNKKNKLIANKYDRGFRGGEINFKKEKEMKC